MLQSVDASLRTSSSQALDVVPNPVVEDSRRNTAVAVRWFDPMICEWGLFGGCTGRLRTPDETSMLLSSQVPQADYSGVDPMLMEFAITPTPAMSDVVSDL